MSSHKRVTNNPNKSHNLRIHRTINPKRSSSLRKLNRQISKFSKLLNKISKLSLTMEPPLMKTKRRLNKRKTVILRSRMIPRLNKEMRSLKKLEWCLTSTYLIQLLRKLNQRG